MPDETKREKLSQELFEIGRKAAEDALDYPAVTTRDPGFLERVFPRVRQQDVETEKDPDA